MVRPRLRALDRKLLRDVWRLKGQVLSIGFVIASGVALLVMSLSTYEALRVTTDAYYDRYRFGDVFAAVKRAPRHMEERLRNLDTEAELGFDPEGTAREAQRCRTQF